MILEILKENKISLYQKGHEKMELYVVQYMDGNKSLCYVGTDHNEANKWLEMEHYSEDEQRKYQLSIYQPDGRLLNTGITKKIKR
jgi:hypothetical protein